MTEQGTSFAFESRLAGVLGGRINDQMQKLDEHHRVREIHVVQNLRYSRSAARTVQARKQGWKIWPRTDSQSKTLGLSRSQTCPQHT